MTSPTQGLVVAALAALLVRISLTGEYLRFVQPWMRWPLLATGALLALMALRPMLAREDARSRVPRSSWLILLPLVIVFSVAPPPLGAYIAERRAEQVTTPPPAPARIPVAEGGRPLVLSLEEFTWGVAQSDDVMGLKDQVVRLEGFVSSDKAGDWYVTALVLFCCAADVAVVRVRATGAEAPPRDQWVRVEGVWDAGSGTSASVPPTLEVTRVAEIDAPRNPYS
ncbi:TIGR03943 family putative permease subunit [Nocardioides daejeonensis]|uniref:TIGR03943 family putative permease subunit n=1 Tax=Nocardioides daejeonensis TaxID=1046556 RepID=UPI000D745DF1|nr:TIGR03943 family protein [Nocardioides daejeonensis]